MSLKHFSKKKFHAFHSYILEFMKFSVQSVMFVQFWVKNMMAFWNYLIKYEKKKKLSLISVVKEAIVVWFLKECLMFMETWKLIFCVFFSKNGVTRILDLTSSTAKGIMKYLEFVSTNEKQVTETYCLIGTSDWFPIFSFPDVSYWS